MVIIHTSDDILRVFRERPEWKAEVRREILTEELMNLPARFDSFVASTERFIDEHRASSLTSTEQFIDEYSSSSLKSSASSTQKAAVSVERLGIGCAGDYRRREPTQAKMWGS